jgi:hypothetical protein
MIDASSSESVSGSHSIYDKLDGKYENVEIVTLDSFCEKNIIDIKR